MIDHVARALLLLPSSGAVLFTALLRVVSSQQGPEQSISMLMGATGDELWLQPSALSGLVS